MYAVRECSRRYHSEDGTGALTTAFHCWWCGELHAGDSWHCPDHQTDVCQRCGGSIYRNWLPRTWDVKEYVEERKQYVPALTITPDDDEFDPESAKGKRERGRPAPERMARGARHGREDAGEPRGPARRRSRSPDRRFGRQPRGCWSDCLVPITPENRHRDWFARKSRGVQRDLIYLLGPKSTRSQDYTAGSWMEALGFALTLLLRHGDRGPYHRGHAPILGKRHLEWASDYSLSVEQVADQPLFKQLAATAEDVTNYVRRMEAERYLDPKDFRFRLVQTGGGVRVKAHQGHSGRTEAIVKSISGTAVVGRSYSPRKAYFEPTLFHGISTGDAPYIYRDGLLVGGRQGYRAHVHLVHGIRSQVDYQGRVRRQGLKKECEAYVVVDARKFLQECHTDGEPVTMFENENGVVLTAGAYGKQPDGSTVPKPAIPPSCIICIEDRRTGDLIPKNWMSQVNIRVERT